MYCKTNNAKDIWESLKCKYKTEDDCTKKFIVARFLDYKMVNSKNVISQIQDLQVLLHDIHNEGMTLSETFQVAAIMKSYLQAGPNPKGKRQRQREYKKEKKEKVSTLLLKGHKEAVLVIRVCRVWLADSRCVSSLAAGKQPGCVEFAGGTSRRALPSILIFICSCYRDMDGGLSKNNMDICKRWGREGNDLFPKIKELVWESQCKNQQTSKVTDCSKNFEPQNDDDKG
ncbi:hypothetical protein Tco_0336189 [Tanacetum coccineum]